MPQSDFMFDGDTIRRLERLERRLTEIESGRRLEDASIGARGLRLFGGGSITVDDGGGVTIDGGRFDLLSDNVSVVYFGPVILGGESGAGFIFSYDDGTPVFFMGGAPGDQVFSFWDQSGHEVLTSDSVSRTGLARPYLQYRLVPSADAELSGTLMWPSTASSTATLMWEGTNPIEQPRLELAVDRRGSGAGTTGHWRLDINGETVLADETTAGVRTVDIPGWGTDIEPGTAVDIHVYAWVTGGAGRTWVQVPRIHGMQS